MYDPYKNAKKYGMGTVISSMTTYGIWNNFKKIHSESRRFCPLSLEMRHRLGRVSGYTCLMGVVSYTVAVITAKEYYDCYRISKRKE